MNYGGENRVEEDYTDEDDEDESDGSPYDQVVPEQHSRPTAHQHRDASHPDNILAQFPQGKDLPKISEATANDEKSYNLSQGGGSQGEMRENEKDVSVTHSEIQNSMSLLQRKI